MNFQRHGTRHHIAPGEVFGVRRVAFHEALALIVDQIAAFAAHAFADEAARPRQTGGMKLPELHVLQRQSGAQRHAEAVAGIDVCIGRVAENATCTAGRQQCGARFNHQRLARLDAQRAHTEHIAVGIAQQIERKIFVEKVGAGAQILLV